METTSAVFSAPLFSRMSESMAPTLTNRSLTIVACGIGYVYLVSIPFFPANKPFFPVDCLATETMTTAVVVPTTIRCADTWGTTDWKRARLRGKLKCGLTLNVIMDTRYGNWPFIFLVD